MLTGCGSKSNSFEKLTEDKEAQYTTLYKDGEGVDVAILYDTQKIYIYLDNDKHDLYLTVDLPTDEIYEDIYNSIYVDMNNIDVNGNSYLEAFVNNDYEESYIKYQLNDKAEYVIQKDASYFNHKTVPYEPLADIVIYEGKWIADKDNMYPDTYLLIDDNGYWQLYDNNYEMIDDGYIEENGDVDTIYSYNNGSLDGGSVEYYGTYGDASINISTAGNYIYNAK